MPSLGRISPFEPLLCGPLWYSALAGAAVTLSVYSGSCTGPLVATVNGTTDLSGNFAATFKTKKPGDYCAHAGVTASDYDPGSTEASFSIAA